MAIDNEQYRAVGPGALGHRAARRRGLPRDARRCWRSSVEYRQLDAFELGALDERFDLVYCFGILHRVENPLALLRLIRDRVAAGGSVLVETYGSTAPDNGAAIDVLEPRRDLPGRRLRVLGLRRGRADAPGRSRRVRVGRGRSIARSSTATRGSSPRCGPPERDATFTRPQHRDCTSVTPAPRPRAEVRRERSCPRPPFRRCTPTGSAGPTGPTPRPPRCAAHSPEARWPASRRTCA